MLPEKPLFCANKLLPKQPKPPANPNEVTNSALAKLLNEIVDLPVV